MPLSRQNDYYHGLLGFGCGAIAAYALSFGLDLLVYSAVGYYPAGAYGPGVLWVALGTSFHIGARKLSASRYAIVVPYCFFGGLAVLTGIVGPHRFNLLVGLPLLVVAALYARQGMTGGPARRGSTFPIGTYSLGGPIQGITGLSEFSPQEYALMPKLFEGETSYDAPPVMFLGRLWGMSLGTVNGRIYKTAPYLLLRSEFEANNVAMAARQFCIEKLGKPTEQKTGQSIWDTTDGNVILETGKTAEGFAVGLYETSSAVKTFKRQGGPPVGR